ncbi:Swt1 family HEPN domain-containing protein [Nakamurella sp. A5-74]|uniref:Swt1 family HEPN domain-containing protein n=1 Tax=Nakamurella sp. A5-74 TaxID=3158264 RepID=A0AAU8DU54_9ACTN
MALSNRDRIGKMMDLLAPELDAFLTSVLAPELGGTPWITLVAVVDQKAGHGTKEYNQLDPLLQLRVITDDLTHRAKPGWRPFKDHLSRTQQSYATELRDTRNAWAHNKPFTDDDAYRSLDTGERFLMAIGAATAATEVAQMRTSLRRVTSEKDDRKVLKAAVDTPQSGGLQPWRTVLRPHDDVASGNFQAAEFAADLFKVSQGQAAADYGDAGQFFTRTYLTDGLRDLIGRATRRLAGDLNASPVINLQTNFGGGKTHSMLSLWHVAAGRPLGDFPQEVQELLEANHYDAIPGQVQRVALVGNHLSTTGSIKPDGTQVNTIWGELAWQLGGRSAFDLVAGADAARTPPGEALHTLLAQYAPAVILIDEWVAYARSLVDRTDLPAGTFDDQFTFAQSLTEAVKGTPGVLLAVSIPASETGDSGEPAIGNEEEVGGGHGREALRRLQNVVRRVADQWRPASSVEAYQIVRQRLFVTPDAQALAGMKATAQAFVEFYRKNSTDFPSEVRDSAYEDRIRQTYPIHPELFDRLYEDWSTLERFQRTRGVLRLMNTVIHALWVGEDAGPLIMPSSIPLATSAVNSELTQYLSDGWKPVIDADVDGPGSEPAKIDLQNTTFGQRSITRRLARTVFFGTAPTLGAAARGLETQRIFLGTAVPDDVPGNFHSALNRLADRATYFYSASGKYWYDLQVNVTRRAKDQAERLHIEDVWAEIERRLAAQAKSRGDFVTVHVCPADPADIPDTDSVKLVVVHPQWAHTKGADSPALSFAKTAVERRGTANRQHRNMIVLIAADAARLGEVESAVRDFLGWSYIVEGAADLDLTDNQKQQAAARRAQADTTAADRLALAYQWVIAPTAQPGQPFTLDVSKVDGQQQASLAERVSKRMRNDGTLATMHAAQNIRLKLDGPLAPMWTSGHLAAGDLWNAYALYPYLPRLRDDSVLLEGIGSQPMYWENEGFATADSFDETTSRYQGLAIPPERAQITLSTLLVTPANAVAQRAIDEAERRRKEEEEARKRPKFPHDPGPTGPTGPPQPPKPSRPTHTRYFGAVTLDSTRYLLELNKVHEEVLKHLASNPGVKLTLSLEIEAESDAGFDDAKRRVVSENATVLKFDINGFDES